MKKHTSLSLKQLLFACGFLAVFAGLTCLLFTHRRDEKLFTRISSELFRQEMTASTLNMHYTLAYPENFGIYHYDAVLPTYSADDRLSGLAATENLLAALNKLDKKKLSDEDAYTCTLLTRSLENSQNMNRYAYYEEPLAPASGMQSQLPILLAEYTFRNRRDVQDYLELLDQTDEYFTSLLAFEQEKAATGLLMSASSLKDVKEQCDTIVSKKELETGTHFLQTTFQERLQGLVELGEIDASEVTALLAQNDRLLKTVMQPAYEALADGLFLLEEKATTLSGLAAKPLGKEYYQYLLISETGSYRNVEDIKALLSAKFQEEYEAIRSLAAQNPEISARLSGEEYVILPYTDAETMLADLQIRMKKDFPSIPGTVSGISEANVSTSGTVSDILGSNASTVDNEPNSNTSVAHTASNFANTIVSSPSVTVKAVSANLEQYCAPAFYLTTPIDDTDNNVIYINHKHSPTGLELYTTLAHEGYPGHLYQNVYSNRTFLENQENNVRQLLWYGGYLEGWALYVEFHSFDYASQLMEEQNRELDALCVQIEKHNRSLQLCLYSLLDIMIHYENASPTQIAKVLEGFGITNPNSVQAVYTYIAEEPCNYLKYYLGYLEILELQKLAKEQWGETYTDLAFHTFYLDCGPSDFTSLTERLQASSPQP